MCMCWIVGFVHATQSLTFSFCSCLTATVTILANDDGHGIISFNNSEHFLLREPTSVSGLGQSVATLIIVRNPPQGIFGTVTVQFSITDANGTLSTEDLTPSEGFVVLEDGVRFKVSRPADTLSTQRFYWIKFRILIWPFQSSPFILLLNYSLVELHTWLGGPFLAEWSKNLNNDFRSYFCRNISNPKGFANVRALP